eukprot:scaffold51168_cov35-Tisochrysis_lutea.AAC.2
MGRVMPLCPVSSSLACSTSACLGRLDEGTVLATTWAPCPWTCRMGGSLARGHAEWVACRQDQGVRNNQQE